MKLILVLLTIVMTSGLSWAKKAESPKERTPAAVSNFKELSPDVSRTLSVLWDTCPDKLADLMQNANAVGKVWYGEKNPTAPGTPTEWSWRITSVRRSPPPFFGEQSVATLKIDWVSVVQSGPSPADRGTT